MSLQILHHGHRERVVVTPTTTMLAVLEEACRKRGLEPGRYALEHATTRRVVDLSLPFRFANLPANAVLELVPRAGGGAGDAGGGAGDAGGGGEVKIALQTPGGERLQAAFPPSASLGDILCHFAAAPAGGGLPRLAGDADSLRASGFAGCALVYMRTTYDGPSLASTTLASMGLTRGAVALRASYPVVGGGGSAPSASPAASPTAAAAAAVGFSAAQATGSTGGGSSAALAPAPAAAAARMAVDDEAGGEAVEPQQQQRAAPAAAAAATAASLQQSSSGDEPLLKRHKPSGDGGEYSGDAASASPTALAAAAAPTTHAPPPAPSSSAAAASVAGGGGGGGQLSRLKGASLAARAALDRLRAAAWDEDARAACGLLLRYLDAVLGRPGDARVRTINLANAAFQQRVGRFPGGVDVLVAAGFAEAFSPDTGAPALILYTPDTHPMAAFADGGDEGGAADGGSMDARLAAVVEDADVVLTVRGAVAAELAALGVTDLPPVPRPDRAALAAQAAAARAAQAAFDPFKAVVTRVTGGSGGAGAGGGAELAVESKSLEVAPTAAVVVSAASASASAPVAATSSSSADAAVSPTSAATAAGVGPLPVGDTMALLTTVPRVTAPPPLSASALALLTDTERKVAQLKWRRTALQAAHAPRARATKVVVFSPAAAAAAANPARFAAGDAAGSGIDIASTDAEVDERDPEVARLLSEWARKKVAEAEAEKGFKTKAVRELEQLQRASVFPSALIRVQLPDRSVAQATFSALEPVSHVYAWVRALLSPAAAALPWFLYTTPPPTALADSGATSMFDARLAPASVVVLGWGTGPTARSLPAGAVAPSTAAELLSPAALAAAVPDFDAPCALEAPAVGERTSSSSSSSAAAAASTTAGGGAFPSSLKLVSEAEAALSSMNLDAMAESLMGRPGAAGAGAPGASAAGTAAAAAARGGAPADAAGGGGSRVARSGPVPAWLKLNK